MHPWKSCLKVTVGTLAVAIAFLIAQPMNVLATDPIDPATQPHLKSWSNVIPAAKRFVVLADFNNEAVLDRETGLVWERVPDQNPWTWYDAVRSCWYHQVGGRMGWHLPTVEELGSLVDPTIPPPGPALPLGHPFQNIQQGSYWSSTTDVRVELLPTQAWEVRFGIPGVIGDTHKDGNRHRWCVRGGTLGDKYK